MGAAARQIGLLLLWITMSVAAAVLYGVVNDQITATISPEYFSVFKQHQFASAIQSAGLTNAPMRVQAVLVGVLSTWWFGLFLGIVLSVCAIVGRDRVLSTRDYLSAVRWVMAATLAVSVLFGVAAYLAEPLIRPDSTHWPFPKGIHQVRTAFAVGWWHNGAYLGALVAAAAAGLRVQKQRKTAQITIARVRPQ